MPGQRSGSEEISCNGGGEAHGRGIPDLALWPIARSTPDLRQGQPRDEATDRREPANQRLITDVSRLRPHRCTIINIKRLQREPLGESKLRFKPLTWDIRARCLGLRPPKRLRPRRRDNPGHDNESIRAIRTEYPLGHEWAQWRRQRRLSHHHARWRSPLI